MPLPPPAYVTYCCGTIYREQNIILSPFDNDVTRNFYARRMFMGAQGVGPLGMMEADPLLIQAEQKLIDQADELVVLVDSSKFRQRSSLILCPLDRVIDRHHRRRDRGPGSRRCSKTPACADRGRKARRGRGGIFTRRAVKARRSRRWLTWSTLREDKQ